MSAEAVRVPPGRSVGPFRTGRRGRRDGGRYVALGGSVRPSAAASSPSLDKGRNNSASCGRIVVLNTKTGEIIGVRCGSWKCDQCSVSNRRAFIKRLRLGLAVQGSGEQPKFLTLTSAPGERPYESRERLARRFAELRRRLGRAFPGSECEYGGVVETTRRGAVHFHVVLRGVPFMPSGPGSPWSRLAERCGFGPVVDIRRARSGLGRYLSKDLGGYLSKDLSSGIFPPHFRRVRFSREWAPGWVLRGRRPRQPGEPSEWVLHRVIRDHRYLEPGRVPDVRIAGQGRSESGGAAADP